MFYNLQADSELLLCLWCPSNFLHAIYRSKHLDAVLLINFHCFVLSNTKHFSQLMENRWFETTMVIEFDRSSREIILSTWWSPPHPHNCFGPFFPLGGVLPTLTSGLDPTHGSYTGAHPCQKKQPGIIIFHYWKEFSIFSTEKYGEFVFFFFFFLENYNSMFLGNCFWKIKTPEGETMER